MKTQVAGIGVDIIEIDRIRRAVDRLGERFIRRIYTKSEEAYCRAFRDPVPHLAARFAAKEAAMKALGVGIYSGIPWTHFEILNHPSGEPYLVLHDKARARADLRGVTEAYVSLSHNRTQALAMVVMCGPAPRVEGDASPGHA